MALLFFENYIACCYFLYYLQVFIIVIWMKTSTSEPLKIWKLTSMRKFGSSRSEVSVKKAFLEIWHNSQENTCARVSFLIQLQACRSIEKEILAEVFSYEFCKIFKTTFLPKSYGRLFPTPSSSNMIRFLLTNSKSI